MSRQEIILDLIENKRLFHLPPLIPSAPAVRCVYVSEEVMEVVEPIWPDFDEGRRFAQLRAALDQFTSNGLISISEEPYQKSKTTFLARVDPIADEVWDIRVQDPKPGIRCLGCFSAMDEFVALTWNFRENLDGPRGPKWAAEINRCKASWRSLFPSYAPHNGSNLNAYVSDKFYAV